MSSDDDTTPPRPKRLPSIMGDDGRIASGREHRRVLTPRPPETFDENSENYQGEELRQIRARRPTPERIAKLEEKHDELRGEVIAIGTKQMDLVAAVSEIKGDVKGVVASNAKVLGSFETYMELQAQRPHGDSIMRVAREEANKTTTATLAERVLDERDQSLKFRRSLTLKIVGGIMGAGGLGALIHYLAGKI